MNKVKKYLTEDGFSCAENLAWKIRNWKWKMEDKYKGIEWRIKAAVFIAVALTISFAGHAYAMELDDVPASKRYAAYLISFVLNSAGNQVDSYLRFDDPDLMAINAMWSYLYIFGVGMLLVYFLIECNRIMLMQGTDFTSKSMMSAFLKLGIGYLFVKEGTYIVSLFLKLNNGLISWITGVNLFSEYAAKDKGLPDLSPLYEAIADMGFIDVLLFSILCIVIYLVSMVASLAIIYQSFSRKLEMIFRIGITPIALGDIYQGGNSTAVRYLKKILALVLYGCGMVAVIKIGTQMQITYVSEIKFSAIEVVAPILFLLEILKMLIVIVVITLAEVGACGLVKQACNDVLGV